MNQSYRAYESFLHINKRKQTFFLSIIVFNWCFMYHIINKGIFPPQNKQIPLQTTH